MPKRKRLSDKDADEAVAHFTELGAGVPNSEATQWSKGKSGNPAGRPKAPDENLALTEMLGVVLRTGKGNAALSRHLINLARGNYEGVPYSVQLQATQYIFDRLEGRPRQSIQQTGNDEPPIVGLLRKLVDDKPALTGRTIPVLPAHAIDATEVRTLDGSRAGADI